MNKINKILADGIENCVEGDVLSLNDSTQAYLKGLKVMGKTEQFKTNGYQLFDASIIDDTISQNGATVTNNGDGSFTIIGDRISAGGLYYEKRIDRQTLLKLFKVGKLTFNVGAKTMPRFAFGLWDENDIQLLVLSNASSESASGTITQDILDNAYSAVIVIEGGGTVTSCTVKPMLYQDGDGTWEEYTGGKPAPTIEFPCKLVSVGDDGRVDVSICGKNMVDIHNPYQVLVGASYTANDGIATVVRGTAVYAPSVYFDLGKYRSWVGKTLTVSATMQEDTGTNGLKNLIYINGAKGTNNQVLMIKADGFKNNGKINFTVTIPENSEAESLRIRLYLQNLKNSDEKAVFSNFQVELGEASTSYEPFKPIQTLTIPTPNGLPGVPVSSNGNYTDASGQQWVCDEIDFDRGVYVQRTYKYEVTGLENWKQHSELTVSGYWRYDCAIKTPINIGQANKVDLCMCTHYKYKASLVSAGEGVWVTSTTSGITPVVGLRIVSTLASLDELTQMLKNQHSAGTPVTFQYILAEPIETPLSEEEIAAYKALHTHYPNTSIHNSDNAHMAVDYVADTKNYIDNKIASEVAKLSAAIITE